MGQRKPVRGIAGRGRPGRPRRRVPGAKLRQVRGRWRVYWWDGETQWEVTLPVESEGEAEVELYRIQAGLASGRSDGWPDWAQEAEVVQRYLSQGGEPVEERGDDELLDVYERGLRGAVSESWARQSMARLRELAAWAERPLGEIDAHAADAYLAQILETPRSDQPEGAERSRGTRNRALAACGRFYRWAQQTGRVEHNPFKGISALREEAPSEIVYCTRREREEILEAAEGDPAELGVWVAFYAGLRLGELARLDWDDVALGRHVTVRRAKTGRGRTVPLHAELSRKLRQVRPRSGSVLGWPAERGAQKWRGQRAIERIGWNAWRHTFGSLAVQGGVPLDTVAAWMGNSPGVCRRHYAEFVPRDRRDARIDRI